MHCAFIRCTGILRILESDMKNASERPNFHSFVTKKWRKIKLSRMVFWPLFQILS